MARIASLIFALAIAGTIACSGGSGAPIVAAPGSSGMGGGSIMNNTKQNANCTLGAEDCIGETYREQGTKGAVVGAKQGRSCANSILGLIASGDVSIKGAAAAGQITKITSVDQEDNSLLSSVLVERCILVNGE